MNANEQRIEEISSELIGSARDKDCNDWPFRNQILYTECNPGLWVQICERALIGSEDDIAKIRLLLEVVNGLRRVPNKQNFEIACEKRDFVRPLIYKLANDCPQKERLLGLYAYHGAMIFHALGKFDEAARCHNHERLRATDDRSYKLAVFCFRLEQFFDINSRRCTSIAEFNSAAILALETLSGDSAEDNRWRANICCHYVFCNWLAGKDMDVNADWAIRYLLNELPEDLAPAFSHALPVIEAIAAYWNGEYTKAAKLASSDQVNDDVDWHGNALLVRLAVRRKQHRATRQVLAEIDALSVNGCGGHVAKAAAKYVGLTLILD